MPKIPARINLRKNLPLAIASLAIFAALITSNLFSPRADAQTFTALYGTTGTVVATAQAGDGALYGLATPATQAGPNGTTTASPLQLFRLDVSSGGYANGAFTVLHKFLSKEGAGGGQVIAATDGNLYGFATEGGTNGVGSLFRWTPPTAKTAGSLTVLHSFTVAASFTPNSQNQSYPSGLIESADGYLYGTFFDASEQPPSYLAPGYVFFRIRKDGSAYTRIAVLGGPAPYTNGVLEASDGNFYGVEYAGVFRVSRTGTVAHFALPTLAPGLAGYDAPVSGTVSGLVEGADGALYGLLGQPLGNSEISCSGSAAVVCGAVFRLDPKDLKGKLTLLSKTHPAPCTNSSTQPAGNVPTIGPVMAEDGKLYWLSQPADNGCSPDSDQWVGTSISSSTPAGTGATSVGISTFETPMAGLLLGQQTASGGMWASVAQGAYEPTAVGTVNLYSPKVALASPIAITLQPASIAAGATATLSWQVASAYSTTAALCGASGAWSGVRSKSGSLQVKGLPPGSYRFALTCGGVTSGWVTLTVATK